MTKFETPFEDTKKIFDELILKYQLDNYVNITLVVNNRLPKLFDPKKSDDLKKYQTGIDLTIVLNEDVFDKFNDYQKIIAADNILAGIYYDTEKDKLIIKKEDFSMFSGIISKYGFETCLKLDTLSKLILSQSKDKTNDELLDEIKKLTSTDEN
jgi:hypothetical protein